MIFDRLPIPIVQAPLGGGPSTPALAAAVSGAGGLGFLAAGYRSPRVMAEEIATVRGLTGRPFGVNLFAPVPGPAGREAVERYAARLEPEARRMGVNLGEPRFDRDAFEEKIDRLLRDPVPLVSFTFGCPSAAIISSLREVGSETWATVTDVEEAELAEAAGASALIVQGLEAGGHRGYFVDGKGASDYSVLALVQLAGARVRIPLVAAGGISTGGAVAAVLAAGAAAAQLGTAFMRCPEAGTSEVHRAALASSRPTSLTRAFSGRSARGVVNRFMRDYDLDAPVAYPEVHHLTAPLRARGREEGDEDVVNLWAGQTHELARPLPAADLVRELARDARGALKVAGERLSRSHFR